MLCLSGFELYSRWVQLDDHFAIRARLDTARRLGVKPLKNEPLSPRQ